MSDPETRDDSGAIEAALARDTEGHPAPTAPVSPLAPEVSEDEYKYLRQAREVFLETGRPPKGYGIKINGDRIHVRRLPKRGA